MLGVGTTWRGGGVVSGTRLLKKLGEMAIFILQTFMLRATLLEVSTGFAKSVTKSLLTMTLPIPQKLRWWAENRLQRIREIVIPVALLPISQITKM